MLGTRCQDLSYANHIWLVGKSLFIENLFLTFEYVSCLNQSYKKNLNFLEFFEFFKLVCTTLVLDIK